jgi:hypothetical protein
MVPPLAGIYASPDRRSSQHRLGQFPPCGPQHTACRHGSPLRLPCQSRCRSGPGHAAAGITILSARRVSAAGLGGGGAGDPARGVTNHGPLASAGLFLALDGLDYPPGGVADDLAAGLGRGNGGQNKREQSREEHRLHLDFDSRMAGFIRLSFALSFRESGPCSVPAPSASHHVLKA